MNTRLLFRISTIAGSLACIFIVAIVIELFGLLRLIGEFGSVLENPPENPSGDFPFDTLQDMIVIQGTARNLLVLCVTASLSIGIGIIATALGAGRLLKAVETLQAKGEQNAAPNEKQRAKPAVS